MSTRKSGSGAIKPSRRRRIALYSIGLGVWITGALWLLFHYFVVREDEYGGPMNNPEEEWLIIAHGVLSFASVWLFGLIWDAHVVPAWKIKWRRRSGSTLFGVLAFLSVTGVALYYIGSPEVSDWVSILHWSVGLAALVAFMVHLLSTSLPRTGSRRRPAPAAEPRQQAAE